MGLTFAQYVTEFANSKGVKTGAIGRIAQNPDQSKHLETATFRCLGLDIDLVNLRSEEYAENSRIPSEVVSDTFGRKITHHRTYGRRLSVLLYKTR